MPPTAREYLQHILDETRYLGANLPGLDRENLYATPRCNALSCPVSKLSAQRQNKFPNRYANSIHTLNGARLPVCEIG
jgi:hypothetical protein